MRSPYTPQSAKSVKKGKELRLRFWLRQNTHFKNTHEFFTAILFEGGAPPHPVTQTYISSMGRLSEAGFISDMHSWRNRIATIMSERLHHSIDPTFATQEYLKWLLQQQEKNRISVQS